MPSVPRQLMVTCYPPFSGFLHPFHENMVMGQGGIANLSFPLEILFVRVLASIMASRETIILGSAPLLHVLR